jgi:gluconolactonase
VSRNGLGVISEDGDLHTLYEEPKLDAVDAMVNAMEAKTATVEHFIACAGETLALPTSLAFGGVDRCTVYVGTLALPHLLSFRSPVAGLPLG